MAHQALCGVRFSWKIVQQLVPKVYLDGEWMVFADVGMLYTRTETTRALPGRCDRWSMQAFLSIMCGLVC